MVVLSEGLEGRMLLMVWYLVVGMVTMNITDIQHNKREKRERLGPCRYSVLFNFIFFSLNLFGQFLLVFFV